jgi:hypothetical protein
VQVARLRLLGDYHHSTRIAFVEFVMVCAFSLICRTSYKTEGNSISRILCNITGPVRLQVASFTCI